MKRQRKVNKTRVYAQRKIPPISKTSGRSSKIKINVLKVPEHEGKNQKLIRRKKKSRSCNERKILREGKATSLMLTIFCQNAWTAHRRNF